jgi:hypothetical protein
MVRPTDHLKFKSFWPHKNALENSNKVYMLANSKERIVMTDSGRSTNETRSTAIAVKPRSPENSVKEISVKEIRSGLKWWLES